MSKLINFQTLKNELCSENIIDEKDSDYDIAQYIKNNHYYLNSDLDSSHFLEPIPGKTITENNKKVFIHGIVHRYIFQKPTKAYIDFLRENSKGWNIVCEDGMKQYLFPNATIFNEYEKLQIASTNNLFLNSFRAIKESYLSFVHRKHSLLSTINTKDDLINIRKEFYRMYLPEPLGMEILEILHPNSLRLKRYVYEADFIVDYCKHLNTPELHVFVGLAHELPLTYLLEHYHDPN